MESDFIPSSEGIPQGEEERPVDAEWKQWLDRASREQYPDNLDPFQFTYSQIARMTVLCYRLFVGLRGAQNTLDGITAGRAEGVSMALLALDLAEADGREDKIGEAKDILIAVLQGKWDDYLPDYEGPENLSNDPEDKG